MASVTGIEVNEEISAIGIIVILKICRQVI